MATENEILNSLKQIIDPDLHKDIVSLGFVKNLKIDGGKVSFDIELTTPACPIRSEFQQKAEEAVRSLNGVAEVQVQMTSRVAKQDERTVSTNTLRNIRSIIAVSSCKGGVGKSTIASHLALELAKRGFKVGLIDADIHGPSIPSLFQLHNVDLDVNDQQQLIPFEKFGLKIMSFGFLLGDTPAVMRGPIVTRYVQQLLVNTAWGELDYLFIDMPPGTGDVQLTITQTIRLSGAVIVTTPQTLSLIDVSRGILMFEKVDVPILGVLENMSYFICDDCKKKHYLFGKQGAESLSKRFGIETLAEIPLLPEFIRSIEKPETNEHIRTAVDQVIRSLGKHSVQQKQTPEIKSDAEAITLSWPNNETITVNNRDLRLSCRCALCINEVTGEKVLRPDRIRPDIAAKKITPLGNYAVGIDWNDGHTSGIYPYKMIRELAGSKKSSSQVGQ